VKVTLLEKIIDSKNTQVGGGAASALSGAMAAGMTAMVARLSIKKGYGLPDESYRQFIDELDPMAKALSAGAARDEEAFVSLVKAMKMPGETEEEKSCREAAIEAGSIFASEVPLKNAGLCREVLDRAIRLAGKSNPRAATDLAIARALAKVGLEGCLMNVEANLPTIQNEATRRKFMDAVASLRE